MYLLGSFYRFGNNISMKDKMINKIDDKFQILYDKLEYSKYLEFIKSNSKITRYDNIMGKISIGVYPRIYKIFLGKKFLCDISKILDSEIRLTKAKMYVL